MTGEGLIKFDFYCEDKSAEIPGKLFGIINPARNKLAQMGLIGQYTGRLSYGNISIREENTRQFYITASGTGKLKKTGKEHYVRIVFCDIDGNFCRFSGKGLPSSETLTHHIIYDICKDAVAVIHIHSRQLWDILKGRIPATPQSAGYGTVEMVKEVAKLFEKNRFDNEKLLVMEGHEEGIISFGNSMEEAMNNIIRRIPAF